MLPAKFVIGRRAREAEEVSSSDSPRASYNTLRRSPTSTHTYARTLTLTFALVAIMTALVLVLVLGFSWETQFNRYARDNMERLASAVAQNLADQYEAAGNKWTTKVLSYAESASATSPDISISVTNVNNVVIYDDSTRADRLNLDPDAVVSADIVTSSGEVVGVVSLRASGSDAMLTRTDRAFRMHSYRAIGIAAVIAVVLACLIGYLLSKSMSRPIKRITSTASQIRNGDLTARTGLTGDDEIGQLGETFDDMANSLEKDLKLERRLTGDVAHELRTPLMAMLVTVEGMQDGVVPANDEYFEMLAGEIGRLSRLVEAMLKLSRMEADNTPLTFKRFDLVWLARDVVRAQEQLYSESDLRLKFVDETPRHELYADIDPDLIKEALINLLSNARRYTPEGGYVVVTVSQEKSDALVSVTDTGIGIAKEDLARIFSRFWRSDASRERASGGLGVGLSITKDIIDRHNGRIVVESELGKGTTFTLCIPIDQGKKTLRQSIQDM